MRDIEMQIGSKTIILQTASFDEPIDSDDLLQIHYHNLSGEAITIPVIINRVGLLKVEAESLARKARIKSKIYEAGFKRKLRREASVNNNYFKVEGERIKLSEKSLEEAVMLDKAWQEMYDDRLNSERDNEFLSILYWALGDKSKKLDVMLKSVVPEEFEKNIVVGKINGMYIDNIDNISIVNRRRNANK